MKLPSFLRETFVLMRQSPVWTVAYVAVLLLPIMLIVARAGAEICVAVMGILFLWHSWRTKRWGWMRDPFVMLSFIAWGWLVLLVTPLALEPDVSAKIAVAWVRFPLMFAAMRCWILSPRPARTTLGAYMLALLALVTLDTLWQFMHGVSLSGQERQASGRLTGPFDRPKVGLFLGKMLLPALAVGGAAMVAARARGWMAASVALLVAVFVAILLAGERSILLVTVLSVAIAAVLVMVNYRCLRVPILGAGIVILILFVGLHQASPWVQQRVAEAVYKISNYRQSDYGLLFITGYEIGREHWLHGVGLEGFRDACPELTYRDQHFRGMHPHHSYIEWFAEAGLPGMLLFIAMVGALLREALASVRSASSGAEYLVAALAVGVVVQHFFPLMGMQSFFSNWSAMLLWYALSMTFAALPRPLMAREKD